MASGLQHYAEMQFEGGGSQSASMKYLAMVAQVVGEATQDEQLLAIAKQLPGLQAPNRSAPFEPQQGILANRRGVA